MADPLLSLRELSEELGNPGIAPLWLAVKRKGVNVSKKQVEAFVKQKGEKQIFQAVQPAKGKTVSESLNARWMMDLIVFYKQPVVVGGGDFALHPCVYQRVRSLPVRRTDQE
jgi:hypothetical protein